MEWNGMEQSGMERNGMERNSPLDPQGTRRRCSSGCFGAPRVFRNCRFPSPFPGKNQQEIQEEIEDLKGELEEEIGKFQKGFRRAQSNAVSLTLDEHCKHPDLVIQGKSWIVTSKPGSKIHPKAVVVAREGFSEGKSYWEVEVGDGSDWELGVLGEEIRDSLRNNGGRFPEETVPGLEYSLGEFRLPGGKLERNSGSCRVLGVLLDQESRTLSFFDAEEKQRLGLLPLKLPGNLFPFFSPSSDGKALGIRPVGVGGPQQ
ncbi:butyrophilin subfamily 1 member A1-like isoform X3 [Corvus kubaryi]|uniref:butyrophilin subfamily 1 member A1-like isoform X3 n=1 Tax=Corvus kubaryi TaxID=68294 RepID=UPI001C05791B|nr:butyrophilin subfamily 1 member A1-like isoform X3 [Corvus kubaryi]